MSGVSGRTRLQRRAFALMLVTAGLMAALGALVYALAQRCDWRVIALARVIFGMLAAYALVRLAGVKPVVRGEPAVWVRSVAGGVGILCTFYALATLPTADALTLMSTTPVWLALIARVWLGHRLRAPVIIAIVISTLGVVLLERPHLVQGNLGALAALGSSFTIAIAAVAIQRARHVDPRAIVLHYSGVALVTTSIIVLLSLDSLSLIVEPLSEPLLVAGLVGVGLLATLGQVTCTQAYALGHAPTVATASYSKIAFAAALDFAIWGRSAGLLGFAGIALIVGSSIWMLRRTSAGERISRAGSTAVSIASSELLDPDVRAAIEAAVARAERVTSCELRVHVEQGAGESIGQRAAEQFDRLAMHQTKLRNGILVYLSLDRREFAVVVDDGIAEIVPTRTIDAIRDALARGLDAGPPGAGIAAAIELAAAGLARYFPWRPGDVDELPNTLSLGGEGL